MAQVNTAAITYKSSEKTPGMVAFQPPRMLCYGRGLHFAEAENTAFMSVG